MAALARLQRPGSTSRIGRCRPSAVHKHVAAQLDVGCRDVGTRTCTTSRRRRRRSGPSTPGNPRRRGARAGPAATHTTLVDAPWAPHTTSGSSALATTVVLRDVRQGVLPAGRHHAHLAHTVELVARQVEQRHDLGLHRSGHHTEIALVDLEHRRHARRRARPEPWPIPGGRLAPAEDVATRGAPPSAAASKRVVVVLPLVPVTRATWRPAANVPSRSGAINSPTRPPMTDPPPRCSRRDAALTAVEARPARRARTGNVPSAGGDVTCRCDQAGRCAPIPRPWARADAGTRRGAGS